MARPIRKDLLQHTITIVPTNNASVYTFTDVRVRKLGEYSSQPYGMEIAGRYELWADSVNTPNFSLLIEKLIMNATVTFVDEYGITITTNVAQIDTPVTEGKIHHLKGILI